MTGIYTEITEIVAPSSAVAGETVDIQVKIKNLHTSTIGIMVGGALDYGVTPWPSTNWDNVAAGATKTFYGSFTMPYYSPGKEIIIHAYSYWYSPETCGWYFDDEKTKVITVAAPLKGTINKKELEYDESRGAIPVSNIPQGKRGLVHVWGRNDTASWQTLGIGWVVTDPDYQVVERHEDDWAAGLVGSGQDREFIGGRFNLDKVGTYRIAIALYMNSADPVEVDRYEGTLCTVVSAVPEPTVSQFEIKDYVKV